MVDFVSKEMTAYAAPAKTQEKSAKEAMVDGRRRGVVEINESVGRRLGFAGGDVIFVKKAPARPATGP
jgi:hypothetical protein